MLDRLLGFCYYGGAEATTAGFLFGSTHLTQPHTVAGRSPHVTRAYKLALVASATISLVTCGLLPFLSPEQGW